MQVTYLPIIPCRHPAAGVQVSTAGTHRGLGVVVFQSATFWFASKQLPEPGIFLDLNAGNCLSSYGCRRSDAPLPHFYYYLKGIYRSWQHFPQWPALVHILISGCLTSIHLKRPSYQTHQVPALSRSRSCWGGWAPWSLRTAKTLDLPGSSSSSG